MASQYTNLTRQKENIKTSSSYFGICKTDFGRILQAELTEYIAELDGSGELDRIIEYWKSNTQSEDIAGPDWKHNSYMNLLKNIITVWI